METKKRPRITGANYENTEKVVPYTNLKKSPKNYTKNIIKQYIVIKHSGAFTTSPPTLKERTSNTATVDA